MRLNEIRDNDFAKHAKKRVVVNLKNKTATIYLMMNWTKFIQF